MARDYEDKENKDDGGGSPVADVWDNTHLNGTEADSVMKEIQNACESADLTVANYQGAGETFYQLAQAMAIYGMGGAEYHIDTSPTGAGFTLDPAGSKVSPPAYFTGMTVSFVAANTCFINPTVSVNGMASKIIIGSAGGSLAANAIRQGQFVTMRYNGTFFQLMDEGISSFVTAGYQIFNSGLILQWGADAGLTAGQSVNFPITYPNAVFGVYPTDHQGSSIAPRPFAVHSILVGSFVLTSTVNGDNSLWFSVGW